MLKHGKYVVEFSYSENGKRKREKDITQAHSRKDAIDSTLEFYSEYCENIKIEKVWFVQDGKKETATGNTKIEVIWLNDD